MGTIKIILTPEQLANLLTDSKFARVNSITSRMDELSREIFCFEVLNFNWDESVSSEAIAVENVASGEMGRQSYVLKYPKEYYDKRNAGKLNDHPGSHARRDSGISKKDE